MLETEHSALPNQETEATDNQIKEMATQITENSLDNSASQKNEDSLDVVNSSLEGKKLTI